MKKRISAIILSFNEEDFIEAAIQSVAFADEIIVLDSYSVDNTVKISQNQKVRIIQREFDDFSSQKNYAIDQADNDWIFFLDADERVTPELESEIQQVLLTETAEVGYFVHRDFYFLQQRILYGGWQTDKVMRLFNKKHCRYNGNLVHELIDYDGEVGFLKNRLKHYSYRSFDHYMKKLINYSTLQARELYKNKTSVSILKMLVKPPFRFFILYIVRLGFMDGFPGFILASQHSYAVLMRYLKLWIMIKESETSLGTDRNV